MGVAARHHEGRAEPEVLGLLDVRGSIRPHREKTAGFTSTAIDDKDTVTVDDAERGPRRQLDGTLQRRPTRRHGAHKGDDSGQDVNAHRCPL